MTMASVFELFLKEFQTPKPMFPFLHSAVENITRQLMEMFIKPNVLEDANTACKMRKIDVKNVGNGVKLRQVKIGPAAKNCLEETRVKKVVMDNYRMDAKNCLVQMVEKLIGKYKFVKASTCLDPKIILTKAERCKTDFEKFVGMLLASHHVTVF